MSAYDLVAYQVPTGKTYKGCILEFISNIRNDIDKAENLDNLFKLTYPVMVKELLKYTYISNEFDYLTPYLAQAFMKTVDGFDENKPKSSFLNYYKIVLKNEILKAHTKRVDGELVVRTYYDGKVSLEANAYEDKDGEMITYASVLESTDEPVEDQIQYQDLIQIIRDIVHDIFNELPNHKTYRRHREMFTDYIEAKIRDEEITMQAIADKYNVHFSTISKAFRVYNKELRERLEYCGFNNPAK